MDIHKKDDNQAPTLTSIMSPYACKDYHSPIRTRRSRHREDDTLIIQGSIRNTTIQWVYINTGSSADIIYEYCFRLLPDRWKDGHKHMAGWITGFTGYKMWPLGTIHLPFMITSYDKTKRKKMLIDFMVI